MKFSGNPPSAVRVADRFRLVIPLDPDYFLVCCEHLYCLHSVQRDRPYWIPPAEASHLNISGKIILRTVRAAGIFLLLPPLDQAYFWICDTSGCDTHSERWRLEIMPPAMFSTCSTEGRHSQVSFGIIDIYRDPTVKL